jgi:hypothetical protein
MKKPTPEELEQVFEQNRIARRELQQIIDRVAARREAELQRRAARRGRLRRLLGFDRAV